MGFIRQGRSWSLARRAVIPLAVASALAGCWYQPGFGPRRSAHNGNERNLTVDNVDTLQQAWSVDLGDGAVSDAVVSRSGVHAVVGTVAHARRLADGTAMWSAEVMPPTNPDGPNVVSAPSVRGSEVLVPSMAQPILPDFPNPTFPGTGVHVYDAATGAEGPLYENVIAAGSATIDGDTLVGNSGVHLIGFDYVSSIDVHDLEDGADPEKNWSTIHQLSGFDLLPVTTASIGGDQVYVGVGPEVKAFTRNRPDNCTEPVLGYFLCPPVWDVGVQGAPTVPVVSDDEATVFVGDTSGRLWAFAASNGGIRWLGSLPGEIVAAPTVGDGTVYATSTDGKVAAFDTEGCGATNCSPSWTAEMGSPVTEQPALAGGVLYVAADDGTVAAFDADGCGADVCPPRWEVSTGSAVTGAPIVANGNLVVGTADGGLIAYRPT